MVREEAMAFGPTQGGRDQGSDFHPHCFLRDTRSSPVRLSRPNVDGAWGEPEEKPLKHSKTTASGVRLSRPSSARF